MLGVPGLIDGAESGAASGGSSGEIERTGGGGNRWPRQETLALLRIRSDMDVAFKDSSLKGPLWEEVSRKMAELGFQRSAKKCKEKFENVYKYHKRTKDGRASKSDGKTYRFFDQLEALEHAPPPSFTPPPPQRPQPVIASMPMPTVSSTSPSPISVAPPVQTASINAPQFQLFQPPQLQQSQPQAAAPAPATSAAANNPNPPQTQNFPPHSSRSSSTSSSSTSSDEDIQMRRGKKRKWKDFFERLMKEVVTKQEELQKKFLETLEKRERDRLAREEAWKVQEMSRMNREHELLVQERSLAAAKDAAVISFLQKVTDQNNLQIPINHNAPPPPIQTQLNPPPPASNLASPPASNLASPPAPPKPVAALPPPPPPQTKSMEITKSDKIGDNSISNSSSRWPKAEVQALIDLRTSMDVKYQENGPKGPLWEEISSAMGKLGYNRSSKRCKEKWENINKYFKKVKESNRKRPDDSKTCPYFHQLEAIYKERAKTDPSGFNSGYPINPENPMAPIMAQPEQQWPLPDQHNAAMRDHDRESDEDDDDIDEEEEGEYEIVATKQAPSAANAAQ